MSDEFNSDEYLANDQFLAMEREDEIQSLLHDYEFFKPCTCRDDDMDCPYVQQRYMAITLIQQEAATRKRQ